MNALLLRSVLVLSSLLALACSDDGSSGDDPVDGSNQSGIESIDTCSGHFICQGSDDGEVGEYVLEPRVMHDANPSCNFTEVGSEAPIHFVSNGKTAEGYRWYHTDLGFVLDYGGLTQNCIAKSLYKPGAFQKKSNGSGSSSGDNGCRASGHFCAASSVCCSSSCSILSNTCN